MTGDQPRVRFESLERRDESGVAFLDRAVEAVVGGGLLGHFPDALDAVQFRGVGRQAEQFDAVAVAGEPALAIVLEPVTGPVVDDQEDFAARGAPHQFLEEVEERSAVEDRGELVDEVGSLLDRDRAIDVSSLALAEGVDARLDADSRPCDVQGAIEPEAGLVAEHHNAAAGSRFF